MLEQLRKRALYSLIFLIILGIFFILSFMTFRSFLVIPMVIGVIVIVIIYAKLANDYRTQVKETIVKEMIIKEFDNVHFDIKNGFSRDFIKSTELISMGNIYRSNDLLSGSYHDVDFKQADVHIQQRTSNGKTTSTVTLFKGRWMVYTFNKRFTGYMQIRSNENRLFGNSKPISWFGSRPSVSRLKMENEVFNQRFNIYASDDHEAYYILTPHFMEKIIELDDSLQGNLVVGFIDNELHIALYNNQDAFEPSIFRSIDDEYYQAVQADIDLIKMVIDELTLDVNLYK